MHVSRQLALSENCKTMYYVFIYFLLTIQYQLLPHPFLNDSDKTVVASTHQLWTTDTCVLTSHMKDTMREPLKVQLPESRHGEQTTDLSIYPSGNCLTITGSTC